MGNGQERKAKKQNKKLTGMEIDTNVVNKRHEKKKNRRRKKYWKNWKIV